jgi:hypothetical protein
VSAKSKLWKPWVRLSNSYEDGYVIPASVYSSIVQHATVTPKVASTTTPVSHASTTTATSVSAASGKPTPLSVQFTAPQVGLNSSAGFTSGAVCIANFFSDVQFDSQFSIFQGMVLQPKTSTTCTGTTCTWKTTDPKRCGGGVCGGIKVPSTMICDNTLKGVDTGLGVDVLSPSTSGYEFEGIPYYVRVDGHLYPQDPVAVYFLILPPLLRELWRGPDPRQDLQLQWPNRRCAVLVRLWKVSATVLVHPHQLVHPAVIT